MNYPYANGVIKSIEDNVFDYAKIKSLIGLSQDDILQSLKKANYGSTDDSNIDELINSEMLKVIDLFLEVMPKSEILDSIVLLFSSSNIRMMYKERIFNVQGEKISFDISFFSNENLREAIFNKNYNLFSKKIKHLFSQFEKDLNGVVNPRLVSAIIDNDIFKFAMDNSKDKAWERYLQLRIDRSNVLSYLRCKRLNKNISFFKEMFITGGSLNEESIVNMFKEESSQHNEKITMLLNEYLETQDMFLLEKNTDELVLEVLREYRYDSFGFGPMLYYLIVKETEAKNIRNIYNIKNIDTKYLVRY